MTIDLIRYKKFTFLFSGTVFVAAVGALLAFGLKPGLDFTGGTLIEVSFAEERPTVDEIQAALEPLDLGGIVVQPTKDRSAIIRTRYVSEAEHQKMLEALRSAFEKEASAPVVVETEGGEKIDGMAIGAKTAPDVIEERVETIGPSISAQLRSRSFGVLVAVNLAILAFVAYAFRRVSKPVASWKYGLATIMALIHDVVITAGVFAILGKYRGVEVDVPFVVALMTILGYSVNDTIVVFDRIRENLIRYRSLPFAEVVSKAVRETLARSINTSMTILLVLIALYFFGGASIHYFALALIIGIGFGTYSSVFVASALLVAGEEWRQKRLAAS